MRADIPTRSPELRRVQRPMWVSAPSRDLIECEHDFPNRMTHGTMYWLKGAPLQNFGDYLSTFLEDDLFDASSNTSNLVHIIGSVIDDMFVPENITPGSKVVFWGCGARSVAGLSPGREKNAEILSVRGPLTASALRLGDLVPYGDPAFVLPALYTPTKLAKFAGRTLCVPHFHDQRTDAEIASNSGAELVVRPNILPSRSALLAVIDAICSAEFTLAGSLHAALIAAAYGRPFGFWDSGNVDIPFKWEDAAASMGIAAHFLRTVEEGQRSYVQHIQNAVALPSMAATLVRTPFPVRPLALLKIISYEGGVGLDHRDLIELTKSFERANEVVTQPNSETGSTHQATPYIPQPASVPVAPAGNPLRPVSLPRTQSSQMLRRYHVEVTNLQRQLVELQALLETKRNIIADVKSQAASRELRTESDHIRQLLGAVSELRLQARIHAPLRRSTSIERLQMRVLGRLTPAARAALVRLREAGLFADEDYLEENPDVAAAGLPATQHFLLSGAKDKRNPAWFFNVNWYARQRPDVAQDSISALQHYLDQGSAEGVSPLPFFDPHWYLTQNPDVRESDLTPLVHFVRNGEAELRSPHPFFNVRFYLDTYPDVAASSMGALRHYLTHGRTEWRRPNPFFDPEWYMRTYPDLSAGTVDPAMHYLEHGALDNREPGPDFCVQRYLAQYPDVAAYPGGALMHYLCHGAQEGRRIEPQQTSLRSTISADPHSSDTPVSPVAKMQSAVLIIDATYPTPDRDSGSQDAINFIHMFQQLGLSVGFISASQFGESELNTPIAREARARLEASNVDVVDCRRATSIADFIRNKGAFYQYFFLSRIYAGGAFFEEIRRHAPESRIIFNTVDLHYLREEREARLHGNPEARTRAAKTQARERYLARMSDATIVVSEVEADILRNSEPGARIRHLPLVREIPGRKAKFSERDGIGFIGGFKHTPNLDAVNYFLTEIWPLVIQRRPDFKFYLFGADMPEHLTSRSDPGLVVIGHVPKMEDAFERIRVSVAPLRYGAGAKGKVIGSLAHGVPCIATPLAAEGMMIQEQQGLCVAHSPSAFAEEIITLHEDKNRWEALSNFAIARTHRDFSLESGLERLHDVLEQAMTFEVSLQ